MQEAFIERGTDYLLAQGKLSVYETNCSCRDVKFYFEQNVLTIMVTGHKTVVSDNLKLEFFPGTFFIPERHVVQTVHIPNATFRNPTKCLVLELKPEFLQTFYEELFYSQDRDEVLFESSETPQPHFLSNDQALIENFIRLYSHQSAEKSKTKDLIDTLIIKEMLLRLFQTEGIHLLKQNFERSVADLQIQKSISYIRDHIGQKITVDQLARVAGLGLTTFFKKFKSATGQSPVDFMLHERINQAKILIQKNRFSLKEVAFRCGFSSYEYFCSSFKKLENRKPTEYRSNPLVYPRPHKMQA